MEITRQNHISKRRASFTMLAMAAFFMLREGVMVTRQETPSLPIETEAVLRTENSLQYFSEPASAAGLQYLQEVRGVYLSSWTAGVRKSVERIATMVDQTELNAVVIDIKDASGRLSYQPLDPTLQAIGVGTNRIADLPALIELLHSRNIYIIGRISVFQDPFFAEKFPDEALKNKITGTTWRDFKGLAYLRPNSQTVWDYTVQIARDAYTQGFDEINLDYVRFPSDGLLFALDRPNQGSVRAEVLGTFFNYIDLKLRQESHIPLSADIFGLTMSSQSDLGIGQILEIIAPHVDYICPMVYPSHFATGSYGIILPATKPYEVVHKSLSDGIKRLEAISIPKEHLRPWLQDFNLGATYTPEMVGAQIQATEDVGLSSWLFWDPKNLYTESAFRLKEVSP